MVGCKLPPLSLLGSNKAFQESLVFRNIEGEGRALVSVSWEECSPSLFMDIPAYVQVCVCVCVCVCVGGVGFFYTGHLIVGGLTGREAVCSLSP